MKPLAFVHETAVVDEGAEIGSGTRIWHFSHVMANARIGMDCTIGQGVFVASGVFIGNRVKIQNNVSVFEGVELEDDVFCGPSCVFTNVKNPRSEFSQNGNYMKTRVQRGATLGANSTVVCGVTVGRYAFIAAGAVISRDVPDYALMTGVPGRRRGWVGRHGHRLKWVEASRVWECPVSGFHYEEGESGLRCLVVADEPGACTSSSGP